MRVLYFSKDYSPHDYRFLAALAQTEHEVYYLPLDGNPRPTEDRSVPPQIHQLQRLAGQRTFRWRDLPRLVWNLRGVIRTLKPDLIHAGPIQTCAFLAILSGFRPVLTMSWGFDLMQDADRSAWSRWVTRHTLQRSTFFVSDAQVTRSKAVSFGMDPERTAVFPWGVDLGHFKPAGRTPTAARKPGSGTRTAAGGGRARKAPFVVFCNRSWEPRYGVDVLARAFVRVAQQRQDVSLLLLGGGSRAQAIRQILVGGHVIERVQFGGQVPQRDLPRWYQMADLYVSPSHVDGSSVSLMEALACGLPVLVSDIPANKEWVVEGENGWLFPDGDVDALAQKIMAAMDGRSGLERLRRAARKTAEVRANWTDNFAVLLEAYRQAAQAKG